MSPWSPHSGLVACRELGACYAHSTGEGAEGGAGKHLPKVAQAVTDRAGPSSCRVHAAAWPLLGGCLLLTVAGTLAWSLLLLLSHVNRHLSSSSCAHGSGADCKATPAAGTGRQWTQAQAVVSAPSESSCCRNVTYLSPRNLR